MRLIKRLVRLILFVTRVSQFKRSFSSFYVHAESHWRFTLTLDGALS